MQNVVSSQLLMPISAPSKHLHRVETGRDGMCVCKSERGARERERERERERDKQTERERERHRVRGKVKSAW